MGQLTDEGYVLRTQPLGDADLIVSFFTLGHGKLRGVARSARRSRKRFGSALEPLTHVRVAWTDAPGRELVRIEGVENERSFAAMQSEPALQAACAVISEVCAAFAHEEQPDPPAFRLVGAVLNALEARVDVATVVRYFEYWMLRIHGLLPELDACGRCSAPIVAPEAAYVEAAGQVVCRSCDTAAGHGGRRLGPGELAFFADARVHPPDRIAIPQTSARPHGTLEVLLRGTLESFAEARFRSYRHLAAALGPGSAG